MAKATVSSKTEGSSSSKPKMKEPQMVMPNRWRVSDDLPILGRIVLIFMGLDQVRFGERFKADQKADSIRFLPSNSTFSTFFNPDREAWPIHFFLRGIKALSRSLEKEGLPMMLSSLNMIRRCREALDLFDDIRDRPEPVGVSKEFPDGTEFTTERDIPV